MNWFEVRHRRSVEGSRQEGATLRRAVLDPPRYAPKVVSLEYNPPQIQLLLFFSFLPLPRQHRVDFALVRDFCWDNLRKMFRLNDDLLAVSVSPVPSSSLLS